MEEHNEIRKTGEDRKPGINTNRTGEKRHFGRDSGPRKTNRSYSHESGDRSRKPRDNDSRPPREFRPRREDGDSRPPREFKPRREDGDSRPPRQFKPRREDGDSRPPRQFRPRREDGDSRPPREFRPRREDGDSRPPREFRPRREDGDSRPPREFRPRREDGDSRPPREFRPRREDGDSRPPREFRPRREDGDSRPPREFRPRREDGDSRPPREFKPRETENAETENKVIKIGTKMVMNFTDISFEGMGVAKINGPLENGETIENFPIFVLGALPFEKGWIEINSLNKNFGYGTALKMFPDSYVKERATPICENYPLCGGCNLMHMNYDAQLNFKRKMVKDTLEKIGTLMDVRVEPVLGAENPFYYRNKVQIPFGQTRFKTVAGFYKRDTHKIIPLTKCHIQSDLSTDIAIFVKNLCNEFNVKGYDEKYHQGDLRHLLVKMNKDNEIMLVFVSLNEELPYMQEMIDKIIKRYPMVKSIILNINRAKGNTTLGDNNITVYGDSYLTDTLCQKHFRIGAASFYQVNRDQTEVLYSKALEIAKLTKDDVIIDAYCGIGTIGIIAADQVKYVYGVEIVEEAIENAKVNMQINHIDNATYVCGKAEEQIIKWMNDGIKVSTIVVDPPRKGCEEALLQTVVDMKIKKMLYISCNPATLARDVKFMVEHSYKVKIVQPVDMFPQSSHIETIVLLEK